MPGVAITMPCRTPSRRCRTWWCRGDGGGGVVRDGLVSDSPRRHTVPLMAFSISRLFWDVTSAARPGRAGDRAVPGAAGRRPAGPVGPARRRRRGGCCAYRVLQRERPSGDPRRRVLARDAVQRPVAQHRGGRPVQGRRRRPDPGPGLADLEADVAAAAEREDDVVARIARSAPTRRPGGRGPSRCRRPTSRRRSRGSRRFACRRRRPDGPSWCTGRTCRGPATAAGGTGRHAAGRDGTTPSGSWTRSARPSSWPEPRVQLVHLALHGGRAAQQRAPRTRCR